MKFTIEDVYAKVLVVSKDDDNVDLRGRLFVVRGPRASFY